MNLQPRSQTCIFIYISYTWSDLVRLGFLNQLININTSKTPLNSNTIRNLIYVENRKK